MNRKILISIFISHLVVWSHAFGGVGPDTVLLEKIAVYFEVTQENSPKKRVWDFSKEKYTFKSLSVYKRKAVIQELQKFMVGYPEDFLTNNLSRIYIVDEVNEDQIAIGGKSDATHKCIYMQYKDSSDYNRYQFNKFMHHEVSHILLRNHWKNFERRKWKRSSVCRCGNDGFIAIKKGADSTVLNDSLCKLGFLHQYAMSAVVEDFASFAENIFMNNAEFWNLAQNYPYIRRKTELFIQFYETLDPTFTEAYFKKL